MRKVGIGVLAVAVVGGLAFLGTTLWKASRTLTEAKARVAQEGLIPFRSVSLDRPVLGGFESISSPAQFRDATVFDGRFYLCGPSGLFAYDSKGSLLSEYRPGRELPPAPLVAMATGVASGSNTPGLWIATSGAGLLIFDGRKFRQVSPEDERSRNLTAVLPLASGRVLIGTERNGVLVWDGQILARYHPSLSELRVTALAGSESDLWIGTIDRGVFRWHAGQLDHFSEADGVPDPRVLSLALDGVNSYVGTALGVAEFSDGRFRRVLASGFFAKAMLVKSGSLLIGTPDEGVLEVSLAVQRPRLQSNKIADADVTDVERLFVLGDHTYALARAGLYEQSLRGVGFRKVFDPPGAVLADGNIAALATDRGGRLWVGYFDRGLDILEPGFSRATHIEDQRVFCVNRIVHQSDGNSSAVGTANGLVLFDGVGKQRRVLGKADGLIANQVTDVLLNGDSRSPTITVATPAGISTIDASGTTSLYAFHGLVNNHVYTLAASGSRMLAGTLGGLSILDSGMVTANFTTANSGLRHNWVTAIVAVRDEWFAGTYGAGVMKLDTAGRWATFADWRAPAVINPNAMLVTDRAVYAGTLGQGLAIYNRGNGRWVLRTAGLPSLNITALATGNGYLYAGADNGLVRILERDLVP